MITTRAPDGANKKDNDKRLMTSSNDKMIFQVLETKRTHFVFSKSRVEREL